VKYFKKRIYLSPPHMSGLEFKYVKEVFKSNWIAPLGAFVDRFENEFARYNKIRNACAVTSGTAAIHLLLRILGVKRGDYVYCSSFTFCGSINPIVYEGAKPVLIDSDFISWNMAPELLEDSLKRDAKRGKLPKAVIVVHLYGQSADMDTINNICRKFDVPVIEDAAEALGARYKNRMVGASSIAAVWSFNGNKIITTSGGGMITSNDKSITEKARFLSTQARDKAPHYQHSEIGYNYRMSNVLAAIGLGQLSGIKQKVERKRDIFKTYKSLLGKVPGISFMPEPEWSKSNRWLTCILVNPKMFGISREQLMIVLEQYNIETRPLWKPMHIQPIFKNCRKVGGEISEFLFKQGLCLPSGTSLTDNEIKIICQLIIASKPHRS
jgi:dTDP-4-amino-4,6-dideoxygalactose transaminase